MIDILFVVNNQKDNPAKEIIKFFANKSYKVVLEDIQNFPDESLRIINSYCKEREKLKRLVFLIFSDTFENSLCSNRKINLSFLLKKINSAFIAPEALKCIFLIGNHLGSFQFKIYF